jgi:hypothetical protein
MGLPRGKCDVKVPLKFEMSYTRFSERNVNT